MKAIPSVPSDWELASFRDIASILVSGVDKKARPGELPIRLCNYTDVYYNRRIGNGKSFMSATASRGEIEKFSLKKGDVLITKDSETPDDIGVPAYVAEDLPDVLCGYHLAIIRCLPQKAFGSYIVQLMQFHRMRHYFYTLANGVTRFGLTSESINNAMCVLPPLPEQARIALILEQWDKASELTEELIIAKGRLKRAIIQRIFGAKYPTSGSSDGMRLVNLRSVTTESRRRNNGLLGPSAVRAVNKKLGMIPMKESVVADSIDRYKVVEKDEFAYNPMRINIGSICRWTQDDPCLVSPDYVVFRCDPDYLDSDYFDHFRRSYRWEQFMARAGAGGVRIRIYFDHLAEIKIPLPSLKEQRRMSTVLNMLDKEISCLVERLRLLKQQKNGLMQYLLTGKWRV